VFSNNAVEERIVATSPVTSKPRLKAPGECRILAAVLKLADKELK